jgi:hypothetical protein
LIGVQAAALFYMVLVVLVVGINIGSSNIRNHTFNAHNILKKFDEAFNPEAVNLCTAIESTIKPVVSNYKLGGSLFIFPMGYS